MGKYTAMWGASCDAARGIKENFGVEAALRYLVAEKLVRFVRAAEKDPEMAEEIPAFVAGVKEVFDPLDLKRFLRSLVPRVGPARPENGEDEDEGMATQALDDDPDTLRLRERVKALLST